MPDNIFEKVKVTKTAPTSVGANSVNEPIKLYQPDAESMKKDVLSNMMGTNVFTGKAEDYDSLASYGAQPNQYQSQSELEKLRAKNQSAWKQAGNTLVQTIGTVIGDTVGGVGMLVDIATGGLWDDKPFSNPITRAGDAISDYVRDELAPIYRENPDKAFDFDDFSGWFFSQVPSIASSLSLMIPGMAFEKGVGAIGKGIGALAKTSSPVARAMNKARAITKLDNAYNMARVQALAKDGITAIGMRLGENYQEARGVAEQIHQEATDLFGNMSDVEYRKWLEDNQDIVNEAGTDDKDAIAKTIADKASMRNFSYNAANVVFDYMQLRAVNKMLGQINRAITPRLRYAQNQTLDRLASTGVEGASQTLGQAAKSTVTGIAGKFNRLINSSENLLVSELSEGVEEAINYVGQEEGTAYGRYLLGQLNDYKGDISIDRIRNYLQDPQLYNSALWGVIGGVVFGGTMSAINNRKGGITDEQIRIAEITGREQVFNQYQNTMSQISQGLNPYDFERDANGNIIHYLDDGTVSQDISVGTPRNAKLTPEEQETMANEAKTRFVSSLTLNAIRAGNYELLQDYINDPRLKKKLIDNGLAEESSFTNDTAELNALMEKTLEKYKTYSTAMRSANIEDALLDIAISENIFNSNEADLLDQRIQKIQSIQNELEQSIPQLGEYVDPMVKNRILIASLEEYRKEAYELYNKVKDSKNPIDKLTTSNYKDLINTIEHKIDDANNLLTPSDKLYSRNIRYAYDEVLGLPKDELIMQELDKFTESEDNMKLYRQSVQDFAMTKVMKELRAINSEYVDNMELQLYHEINRDNFRSKVATTNEEVQRKAQEIKADQERAAKLQLDTAKNAINGYIATATDEQLAALNRVLNNQMSEEDTNNPEILSLSKAADIIKSSKDKDKLLKDIQSNIAKTNAHNERVRLAKEQADKAKQAAKLQPPSLTGEVQNTPTETTNTPPFVQPAPAPKTEEEKQLKATLDKVVSTATTSNAVTNANIDTFNYKISTPFSSVDYIKGKPVKVYSILVEKSRFGNVSINGYDKAGKLIADVTIEELNIAIANNEIEITPKTEGEDGVLESAVQDLDPMRQRVEEIKLIIDLYNKINGNTIEGKNFTSVNDMMVYLQRLNPNAINLYNDMKIIANSLIADGKIISTDVEYKTPNEIVAESKKTLDKAISEKKKEDNSASYYFDLINLEDSKVYTQIGKLRTGNTVTVELDANGHMFVKSKGLTIGELPFVKYENGCAVAINQGWTYTISNNDIAFISRLKDIVSSNDESAKEFLATLSNIRRLFKVRNNPDIESTFGHLLNTLQENELWKELNTRFGNDVDLLTKVKHLNNIIFFDYNVSLASPYFSKIVSDSLNNWMNKIKKSYSDINNLRSSISKNKSKSKRLTIGSTSSGSLIYAKDGRGNPKYSSIAEVTTADITNGFQLVRGGDECIIDIKTGQRIEASGIKRGVVGVVVKDSEGRLMTAATRENTMANSHTKETAYTKAFNEGLDSLFTQLLKATHDKNVHLHDALLKEIDKYIGAGKPLFGYRVQGNALIPNLGRQAPTIWFNINQDNPNVKFIYPDGSTYNLSAYLPNTRTRPTNTNNNFAKAMQGVYSTITRNVVNSAVTNESDMFRIGENGTLEARIPNLDRDVWFDTGYSSYNEFVANDGVVVTDLGAIRDDNGNIISNFNFTNDRFNKRITLVAPVRSKTAKLTKTTPVKESSPAELPTPTVVPSTSISGTITEIATSLTNDKALLDIVSSLEQAGLTVNPTIETNDKRFASIIPGTNELILTSQWQTLDATQKVLKIVHEGVHFLLNDERANIEQSFGDLYDKFASFIKSDSALANTYSKYLKEGYPRAIQIEEFVTEALTSRELARLLSTIKYDSKGDQLSDNLFTKIVEAIANIIGKINSNLDNTMLGEIRNRLSQIGQDVNGETQVEITSIADEDIATGIPDFDDFDGLDLLDSAVIDNYGQVDNFDTYIAGLTERQKATVTRLFNEGALSFVCE